MKYYITDSELNVIKEFTFDEFQIFLKDLLYKFKKTNKTKYEYNIKNFITYFYKHYFVSGKETFDSYELIGTFPDCEIVKVNIKKDNLFMIVEAKTNKDFKILNAESIFFNYSPEERKQKRFRFNFYYSRYSSEYTGSYYHPGNGRRTAVYDTRLDEAEEYCREMGYRFLKPRRRLYVNPWDEDKPKNIHSKSWKEMTKRTRQFK